MKALYLRIFILQCSIAAIYLTFAIIALEFAVIKGNATLIWPSAGIALATLIRLGTKYAWGIFLGAFAAAVYAGEVPVIWWLTALGNTLEPLLALYLLQFLPFSKNVYHNHNYLSLLLAASIGSLVSAFFGCISLILAKFIAFDQVAEIFLHWWMADTLGSLIIAPFLLLFSWSQIKSLVKKRAVEALVLISLSVLIAFIVLADWKNTQLNEISGNYLLTIPLIWSALRFGQVLSSFIIAEFFIIGVYGMLIQQGLFIDIYAEPNLISFWCYFTVISLTTMLVAYTANHKNTLHQAINNSQAETYILCEDDIHFEFVNQCALDNLRISRLSSHQLTPIDLQIFHSEQQLHQILTPLREQQVSSIDFDCYIKRPNGSLYPVEINIKQIEHSNRFCYLISAVDITDRLEKERHLRLGNYVCELSPQAILITDSNNQIIRVNQAFSDITGYKLETVIGLTPHILSSGRHDKKFYQTLWNHLSKTGSWSGEIYNRRQNGELYLQSITIKTLFNVQGKIENYIAIFTDITKEREKALNLKHLSEHDVLTGLPNKTLLVQEFNYALATSKRQNTKLGILFIDLNDFKPINDNYGHISGDSVLKILASKMQNCIRETDMVSRFGGDEFIVLVTNIDSDNACEILRKKLKEVIAEKIEIENLHLQVSASIGIATYPEHGNNLETLVKVADNAMYKDKERKKH